MKHFFVYLENNGEEYEWEATFMSTAIVDGKRILEITQPDTGDFAIQIEHDAVIGVYTAAQQNLHGDCAKFEDGTKIFPSRDGSVLSAPAGNAIR